ncbi:MAG: hypothetical protein P1P90_02335 [Patescibacteria group bacterium]|nr:hypothetical protein [Patescibacteria group bacterium]
MAKNKLLLLFLILAGSLFGIAGNAGNANAIAVSPVVIEHELAPGMSASGKIRLSNLANETQKYYVDALRFVPVGEEGRQEYINKNNDITGFSKWFSFGQTAYDIDGMTTIETDYTITAPLDAEPGGHYGAVFYSLEPPETDEDFVGSSIASKTGVLFLIKVAGDIVESANIESFTSDKKVYSHLPSKFDIRIRNNGNVHFRPQGTVEIRNMWGAVVAKVPANPSNSAVLPNSIRKVNTWWTKSDQLAVGGFFAGVSNEWNNFALGRYTATVNATYGSQNTAFEQKAVTFWAIPWRLTLILIILIIALYIAMSIYNKAIVSSAINKSNQAKKKK